MADDELPCTQIVACRRYSLTIRRSEQFLHPLHPSVRHRLVIMQGIGRDGRHLTGGDPGTCLVVAGSERQGKPARARAAQRHLMIQYDRLTMVKQLHANTLRPIVGGVIAQNAMPPGGEGSAPSTRREIVTALLQSSCSAKGVSPVVLPTPPKWSSIAAGSLIRAGVASFTEHPAVLILPVKSNAVSGVCSAIKSARCDTQARPVSPRDRF